MKKKFSRMASSAVVLGLLALSTPFAVEAQRRGSQPATTTGWAPISAGFKAGYDNNASGEMLGVQLHLPIVRNGQFELMPNADVTFLSGLKEYQYALDALFVPGGTRGGPYLGGGVALRNTIYDFDRSAARETRQGYSVIVGGKLGSPGALGIQIEVRWTFLDSPVLDPRTVTFGVNFPLSGRRPNRGS